MLDTIKVRYEISPTESQLDHWQRIVTVTPNTQRERYIFNAVVTDDEIMVKYTFFPKSYEGKPMLLVETSLPKLIFGNNFQMIQSIEGTIQIANAVLSTIPHAPEIDLAEGILSRLDLCYNHQVGDMVDDYIKAMGYLDYPHRRTKYHRYEGTEFRSKHTTSKFYNKQLETGTPDAYGILRQEITILKAKNIKKLTGINHPTLMDISPLLVKETLETDLVRLKMDGNIIATRDIAVKVLSERYGHYAGLYHYALIDTRLSKSKKQIALEADMHPRSIDRRIKAIADAGIAPTLTERDEPLPPLEINF